MWTPLNSIELHLSKIYRIWFVIEDFVIEDLLISLLKSTSSPHLIMQGECEASSTTFRNPGSVLARYLGLFLHLVVSRSTLVKKSNGHIFWKSYFLLHHLKLLLHFERFINTAPQWLLNTALTLQMIT